MRALQYVAIGEPPVLVDIPRPTPSHGQVLVRVLAAGMCHTDLYFMGLPAEQLPFDLPLTLGHECVGVVDEVGSGVRGVEPGQRVAVYGAWGCGTCGPCRVGEENYCLRAAAEDIRPPGLGVPGAMAEYMIIDDARHLIPIGDLDPVDAVALTDAALTPFHAIRDDIRRLGPASTAVVVGVGGLGHVAVQILRALTATTVVAVDHSDDKRELASSVGAHHTLPSDELTSDAILELTGGVGADVVLDFVGSSSTTELAAAAVRINGSITVVGAGGGRVPVGLGSTKYGVRARSTYWGTIPDLHEVIALARRGLIRVTNERFSLADGPQVYERLARGEISGRAVLVP